MRFAGYLGEETKGEVIARKAESIIMPILEKDCGPFLKALKGCSEFFYRGTLRKHEGPYVTIVPRKNREPRDTDEYTHERADLWFSQKFHWFVRSEGVFAISNEEAASSYAADSENGDVRIIFPAGNFRYVWSREIPDFIEISRELFPNKTDGKLPEEGMKYFKAWVQSVLCVKFNNQKIWEYVKNLDDSMAISTQVLKAAVDTYTDKDLCNAATTGHEIAFKCDKYYLVSLAYRYYLRKRILGV